MKELWKNFRLAAYIIALPLIATAALSAYQWTSPQDQSLRVHSASATIPTTIHAERSHSLMLDENGVFHGRIWSPDAEYKTHLNSANMDIALYQSGNVIAQAKTNDAGQFSLPNVQPGIYSFVARGNGQMSMYAVRLQSFDARFTPSYFEAITVPTSSTTQVRNSVNANEQQSEIQTVNQYADMNFRTGNQIQLDRNNNLYGSLVATINTTDVSQNTVSLMRNGHQIATATPTADGKFVFSNVQPGKYDFVSSGPNGAVAIGLEAVSGNRLIRQTSFAPTQQDVPNTFDVPLTNPNDFSAIFPRNPFGGFFPSGGGFGSNGFGAGLFAGGGGGRLLLGLAGFGLGLGAILDNNPAPTSPTK